MFSHMLSNPFIVFFIRFTVLTVRSCKLTPNLFSVLLGFAAAENRPYISYIFKTKIFCYSAINYGIYTGM